MKRSRPIGKASKTCRGFGWVDFKDSKGVQCSISVSSLACVEALWIGCCDPDPKVLTPDNGWQTLKIPDGQTLLVNDKMHLTKSQIKQLISRLQLWVDTGSLGGKK